MIAKFSDCVSLDLRGIACPVNLIRCRLALEDLSYQDCLEVYLDKGEPEETVVFGLKKAGHQVEVVGKDSTWIRLMVVCGGK